MSEILIYIKHKIAKIQGSVGALVCGNDDYTVRFLFDEEWDDHPVRTARFVWDGQFCDVELQDGVCTIPLISDATTLLVGVWSGDLCTTTPAELRMRRSILSEDAEPAQESTPLPGNKAQSLCQGCRALGKNATAGSRGFRIIASAAGTGASGTYTLDGYDGGYEVGDEFSLVIDWVFDFDGVITAIDGNKITVDKWNSQALLTGDAVIGDKNTFRVPAKPQIGNLDIGTGAFSAGLDSRATGPYSTAFGYNNRADGRYSIVSGQGNRVANSSAAFGQDNDVTGENAHASGRSNQVSGAVATAFGEGNIADGLRSMAVGRLTNALEMASFASGMQTTASGRCSFAGGNNTQATNHNSVALGSGAVASGADAFTHGRNTVASGDCSVAHGEGAQALGYRSTAFGQNTVARGVNSIVGGENNTASGTDAIALGKNTVASGAVSVALGIGSKAEGFGSVAVGNSATAQKDYATAFGQNTTASGAEAFAGGRMSKANGDCSVALGNKSTANGFNAFAMGDQTQANAYNAVAFGLKTQATGEHAMAINEQTRAIGARSFVQGLGTRATQREQAVFGKYNLQDTENKYALIVGNGTSDEARSNAFAVTWEGGIEVGGKLLTPAQVEHLAALTDQLTNDQIGLLSILACGLKKEQLVYCFTPLGEDEALYLDPNHAGEVYNDRTRYADKNDFFIYKYNLGNFNWGSGYTATWSAYCGQQLKLDVSIDGQNWVEVFNCGQSGSLTWGPRTFDIGKHLDLRNHTELYIKVSDSGPEDGLGGAVHTAGSVELCIESVGF